MQEKLNLFLFEKRISLVCCHLICFYIQCKIVLQKYTSVILTDWNAERIEVEIGSASYKNTLTVNESLNTPKIRFYRIIDARW